MAALLRSLATKVVARAPAPPHHRLPSLSRRLHHSGPGKPSIKDLTLSEKLSNAEWERTMALLREIIKGDMIRSACTVATVLMIFHVWYLPRFSETLSRERLKMENHINQIIDRKFERMLVEDERCKAKISKALRKQTSGGHVQKHGGSQA